MWRWCSSSPLLEGRLIFTMLWDAVLCQFRQPFTVSIDLHLVGALTVPMHLSNIDGPFVSHNLMSTQDSPFLLPQFRMAPRIKILIFSGSKKSRRANPLQVPQWRPLWGGGEKERENERDPLAEHFYISLTHCPTPRCRVLPEQLPGL